MKLINLAPILIALLLATACNSGKEAVTAVETAPAPETTETVATPPQRGQGGRWQQDPERKAKYEAMLTSLNMTEKQREDFDFISEKYRAQMQQARQNAGDDRVAMRSQMMELRTKQNAELKEVLNEEQFAAYEKWQQENRRGPRGGRNPGN